MIERRDDAWKLVETNPADSLEKRLPAFVPDWAPADSGPGRALLEIAERFASIVAERLARAPDKAKLAFLDALGVEPIPPRPARAPVVFELAPEAAHGKAPARAQLMAQPADGGDPLIFETESAIGLAASRLVEVKASLPGHRFTDHSQDVAGEKPFVLFAEPAPIPRELYLAHDRLLDLTRGSVVELRVEAADAAAGSITDPPDLRWEYFDGGAWSPFAPFPTAKDLTRDTGEYSADATRGLSRGGTITLRVGGNPSAPTKIRGIESRWIRARVIPDDPNKPRSAAGAAPLLINRIELRSVSKVGGFHVAKRTETLIATKDGAGRRIQVRLVDDRGAPLALSDGTNSLTVVDLNNPANVFKPSGTADEPDGFVLESASATELRIRVSWGKPPEKGKSSEPALQTWDLPPIHDLRLDRSHDVDLARAGRLPTKAIANGAAADPTAPFQPFGPQPQPGATFLFACPEVLAKPGAKVTIFTDAGINNPRESPPKSIPTTRWEYWNGDVWAPLPDLEAASPEVLAFHKPGEIRFTVPPNAALKTELGQEQLWARVTLAKGDYLIPGSGRAGTDRQTVFFDKVFPPTVRIFRIAYEYVSSAEAAGTCLTLNDFQWTDHTTAAAFGGDPFEPFQSDDDARPTLYLGFTRVPPIDLISLFIDVRRSVGEPGLLWEYHDGVGWRRLALKREETKGLSSPGLVQFIWPGTSLRDPEPVTRAEGDAITFLDPRGAARFNRGDPVAVFEDDNAESAIVRDIRGDTLTLETPLQTAFSAKAVAGPSPLPRFGSPRHWVRIIWPRAEVPRPGDADAVNVAGIYLNAAWAEQARSVVNETIGGTTGAAGESFDLTNRPVLEGEKIEVLELDGPLAEAGSDALLKELMEAGGSESDLTLERDEKTGKAVRAWVAWRGRPNFAGSGPLDRHYVLERARGSLQFGDGRAGRIPPVNPNNLRASYRTGGGKRGNQPARLINVALGGAVQSVFNPIASGGGADGELMSTPTASATILDRGPQLIRHRWRALTAADYEQLARGASPAVAVARVVAAADRAGGVPAGSVRVIILPHADERDPEPTPSPQLIADVTDFLRKRAPIGVADSVTVVGPTYLPVGVDAALAPAAAELAGQLARDAKASIARFLHPVVGGPDGRGWGFGQAVYRSDLIKWLHGDLKSELAYVSDLRLLNAGQPVPERLAIPPDQTPRAGPIRVTVLADSETNR